ncbi:DUF4861 domain-containing protein [Galbibacter mesophilus]|uniref:DUF4861 domain-containing protein n=1 Tax=Galbibacter mesophilus TaxID=379069 RepID=UPI00191EBF96|nr:DUF4861 domain-containing protein [Galbibacter mesophilus]MCM5662408.1 DUF4861 domain-containing protein [Galbibacter mesophilus]
MKPFIYSLFCATILVSSCAKQTETIVVEVENSLDINRSFETVEIDLSELSQSEEQKKYANWGVKDASSESELVSQLIDEDQDGEWDLLIFQPEIKASSKMKFEIFPKETIYKTDSVPACFSRFVPERTDDYAWENNRVAFRTYGPKAQKMVEDSIQGGTLSSGIDAWLKRVEYPIINKWYEKYVSGTGTYHEDTGEGLDNFHVGKSRGIGGVAKKVDTSYFYSKNFVSWETITTGPLRTSFVLKYADWDAGGKSISEEKHISLDYGQNLSKFKLKVQGVQTISTGITLHKKEGDTNTNIEQGWMSYWEPHEGSELGMGIVTKPENIVAFDKFDTTAKDESNLYAELKLENGEVVYYAGFGWKKSNQFTTQKEWEAYLADFSKKLATPLKVTLPLN